MKMHSHSHSLHFFNSSHSLTHTRYVHMQHWINRYAAPMSHCCQHRMKTPTVCSTTNHSIRNERLYPCCRHDDGIHSLCTFLCSYTCCLLWHNTLTVAGKQIQDSANVSPYLFGFSSIFALFCVYCQLVQGFILACKGTGVTFPLFCCCCCFHRHISKRSRILYARHTLLLIPRPSPL